MKRSIILFAGALVATSLVAACGDDGEGSSDGDYCKMIVTYRATADGLDSVFLNPTPESAEAAYSAMQDMLSDLAGQAPAEIKADVAVMKVAIDKSVDVLTLYDWDLIKAQDSPEMTELQAELGGEEMQAASGRLDTYSQDVCGLPAEELTP